MLKKVQIFKALDIEIKKQKGPAAVKDAYKGHHSLKEELSQPGISIIAETAGGNPLRGQVRDSYRASTHAKSLVENGAKVISVATDRFLFYGEDKHLSDVRSAVKVPLLRHDFIFEEYQIEESKILGADGVFLMASLLEPDRLAALQKLARAKSLDVIVEVASEADLKRALDADADIVCVLGRDLDTWEPRWEEALALLDKVPQSRCLRILEAGVSTLQQIQQLEAMGVHGVMVGDALLDEFYPGKRLAQILAGVEIPKKPIKTKGRQDLLQDPSAKVVKQGKAAAGPHEASKKKTGGSAAAGKQHSPTHTPQPAREGKKEFPMEQIHQPDETTVAVASDTAEVSAAPKKLAARKPAAKKPAAKKPAAKKPAAKKPAAKKPAAKKPAAKKPVAKKAPVKKAVAKKAPVKKAVAKKAPVKKAVAKKAPVKKAVAKKAPVKKAVAKKAPVKKVVAKKAPVKKAVAKKAPAKKVVAKKAPVKKAVAKKAPAKKATKK
ncbi:MAG: indole-3-glycerol-phosphate synthase [Holophaga sp.]|nr:indole-3-glycerol-phosphate synthase [Holophaga sp.]